MNPDLWLAFRLLKSRLSVSLGPDPSSILHCDAKLVERDRLASDVGRDLSRVPWTVSVFRGGESPLPGEAIGVAFPSLDPDQAGTGDFMAAEATVSSPQFDRLLQLLTLAAGDPELHLQISGLAHGQGPLDKTPVWTLPDTLPVLAARVSADVFMPIQLGAAADTV